jgi:hypothetical protein
METDIYNKLLEQIKLQKDIITETKDYPVSSPISTATENAKQKLNILLILQDLEARISKLENK